MSETPKDPHGERSPARPDRRTFLVTGAGAAAATLVSCSSLTTAGPGAQAAAGTTRPGHRRLGQLEVSEIGMGVQNMSRKYETTVPYRPQMIQVIRAAFDRGVTFFDAAEAYGPFEVERILGEGIAPFRDKAVITSKFGWNIDQETGRRLPGLNSKPEHVKRVVDGMLGRLRTDRIDLLIENTGAAAVRFTPGELAELNTAVRAIEVRGARLPEQVLVFSGVEAPPQKKP